MISSNFRRCLSFVLAMVMVFSFMPLHTLATEPEASEYEDKLIAETAVETTETVFKTESAAETELVTEAETIPEILTAIEPAAAAETGAATNALLQDYQSQIDALLIRYLGTTSMSTEEVYIAVAAMDYEYQDALFECYTLDQAITDSANDGQLTEEELHCLSYRNDLFGDFFDALSKRQESEYGISLLATTQVSLAGGAITVEYDTSYSSITNGNVSVSITGGILSRYTTSITISNSTTATATLAFDYSASNYNSFTIGGSSPSSASDNYSADLAAGASIEVKIQSNRKSSGAATLTISNIKLVSEGTLTLDYNTLGSVTVAGTTVADGSTATIPKEGATIVATPISGATFLGWVNSADRSIVSQNATHLLTLDKDTTIEAVFVNSSSVPYFRVGTAYLFDNLTDAIECTKTSGVKTIISVNDGTLAVDNYTIPSDVTFLIPFNSADTICTDDPSDSAMSSTSAPSAYRTLKVPAGATIVCNGILNINGQRRTSGQPNSGTAAGKHGKLVLEGSGTQLTIASGGKLYCYGYITGSGKVELASSSEMHELLQMCDWSGGTNASNWNGESDENTLFLSSRYYVQNVEAPLRVNNGASVYCEAILYVSSQTLRSSTLFVAPSGNTQGLFLMGSGTYLDRSYNSSNDRVTYSLGGSGTVTFGSIEVELDDSIKFLLSILGINLDLNSSSYVLPINNAMTIKIGSGITVNMGNRVAILPGAEVIIDEGGRVNLTNYAFIFDLDDWTASMVFGSQKAVPYTTGRGSTATLSIENSGKLEVNGTLNITGNGGIYTTTGITTDETTSSSADKIITGTGTIIHEGTTADATLKAGYNATLYALSISNGLANLAGLGTMKSLGNSTYYGLGKTYNNYWYETKSIHSPTCTEQGYTTYNCADGSGYVTDFVDPIGHKYDEGSITTNPTCTDDGVKTYTCQNDATHTKTEKIVAAGHSYDDGVITTAPTCATAGVKTFTCATCGDTYTEPVAATGHSWSGTNCTVCGLFKLYATNLRAGDYLDMYFYVEASDLTEGMNYYAHVVKTFADGRDNVERTIYYLNEDGSQNWETYQINYLRFSFDDISAKEMTDEIHVTIYDSQGKQVSTTQTETIQTYTLRLLSTLTGDGLSQKNQYLRTTLIDMLNYGAAAQDYFDDYNIGDLATAGCDAYQQYASSESVFQTTGSTDKSGGLDSATVIANNGLTFCLFFNNINQAETAGLTAYISYPRYHGKSSISWSTTKFNTTRSNLVGVDITGIAIADGRQPVTCEIKNSANEVVASGTYSIEHYLELNQAKDVVFLNLRKFVYSAIAYFSS